MLDMQIRQFQQQLQSIDQHIEQLDNVQSWISDYAAAKDGSEVFVTLAPGILAKAKIIENDSVLMNVGAGTIVRKEIKPAQELLEQQVVELRKMSEDLGQELITLSKKAEAVQHEVQKLIENV